MQKDDMNISYERSKNFQKVLIVSDNKELSIHFQEILNKETFSQPMRYDLRYSSSNHDPRDMIAIGAKEINLKDANIIQKIIDEYEVVFSLHCKQIFPKVLVENVRCVNVHPGLNPYNRGWFPQAFSIVNGLPIGATIHIMDDKIDHGPIIAQKQIEIGPGDTSFEAYRKIIGAEKELIKRFLPGIIAGNIDIISVPHEGNYNSLNDFREMCQLDLSHVGTLREHLNLLRATTHGDFRNASFLDEKGKRYFVRVLIDEDHSG